METVLQLLKMDLGISHTLRDTYFNALLSSSKSEIEKKGVVLDLDNIEDQMLLSDYATWTYRKRTDDVPLARNLELRIRNKIIKARGDNYVG